MRVVNKGRVIVRNYMPINHYLIYTHLKNAFGSKLMTIMLISLILCLNDEKCREWVKAL